MVRQGSGLGLAGLALRAASNPTSVTLTDRDPEVLELAAGRKEGNLPTEILLEDTDGLRRPPSKGDDAIHQ